MPLSLSPQPILMFFDIHQNQSKRRA